MARKANTATVIEHTEVNEDWVGGLTDTANQAGEHSQEIMAQYGEGLPYERSRIVREAQFYMAQSAEAMLEAGKRLIMLKEHEPHGEFIHIVESQMGMGRKLAARTMQAAIKFSNVSSTRHLVAASQGKTKLFELMVLDEGELEQLGEGGTVAGIDLDDVERMTCSELRKKLREARESIAAKDAVAGAKQQTIDELMEKNARIKNLPADEAAAELRAEASTHADAVEERIRTQLRAAFAAVFDHGTVNDDNPHLNNGQLSYLESRLDLLDDALLTLRAELGIERTVSSPLEFDPSK